MTQIMYLDTGSPVFPPTHSALQDEPNGLLAIGGNLEPETLIRAYSLGIFPWFSPGEPILWWSPSPRMTLTPEHAHISRSLKKLAKKKPFLVTVDQAFKDVIMRCANVKRKEQAGTWITNDMQAAYLKLHTLGFAHSVEVWDAQHLVGGLYGIAIGSAFFGESMFSLKTGASKLAFASLCTQLTRWHFSLIDCQVYTPLLASFGAEEIDRPQFESQLAQALDKEQTFNWSSEWSLGESGFDGS